MCSEALEIVKENDRLGRSIGKSVVWCLLINLHVLETIPEEHTLATSISRKEGT